MTTAKEKLVETLTNALAVSRIGRLDEHRKTAEHLVDEFAHELSEKASAEIKGCCQECDAAMAIMKSEIDPYEESE